MLFKLLFSAEMWNQSRLLMFFMSSSRKLGGKPAECTVVEDSANGSRAAKTAGMTCIGFKKSDSGNQDLSVR